jgi:hypothetical protein
MYSDHYKLATAYFEVWNSNEELEPSPGPKAKKNPRGGFKSQ